MASAGGSQRCHARLPTLAVLAGALLLAAWAWPGSGFVAPRPGPAPRTASAVPRGAKSLFERTKELNKNIQEANGENELLMDTDAVWSVGYVVAGLLATWLFVSVLYSLKPEA
mmetsp:Transcript_141278/g.393751  ORF Transcript_141278/g.393751 Transcript_141278/m.393751 type:complete len:113 (+) Transcript_141278:89-427(+)